MFDLVECEEETEDGDVDFTVSIGRCYFPRCSAAKTAKSVKCSEPPDFDLWKSYPARSLGSYGKHMIDVIFYAFRIFGS